MSDTGHTPLVRVKPLEWVDGEAKTPFGSSYTVHRRADGMYEAVGCGAFVNGPHRDMVSAKAAAQSDYERRILSAIEPSPSLPILVEALAWYENNAAGCRLIHSGGDAHRAALAADGGDRARAALASIKGGDVPARVTIEEISE